VGEAVTLMALVSLTSLIITNNEHLATAAAIIA
jgi:hypothetical protein